MANTSVTLEELRVLYNRWRTAWRPIFHGLAGTRRTSSFTVPSSYKYIKVFGTHDPDSILYPYVLHYEGMVDNMPNPLYVCNDEHYIVKLNSPNPNMRCYAIEMNGVSDERHINNPLQVLIRMEEV